MSKKRRLGDLLIESGLVSRLQIDQALQAQQIFGDRIGTNLIEMGAIDGDSLAGFLSQQFGVPRATGANMEKISKDVLDLVPAKAAHRLCILPLARSNGQLCLAMIDPSEARIASRIGINLQLTIDRRVATEIEIRYYLEKHYGMQREMRHIRLMNQILEQRSHPQTPARMDLLTSQLDPYVKPSDAIEFFFDKIKSLEKIPQRNSTLDLTKFDLTPELTFLLLQVDGLSNFNELFSISPFPRITTLRAFAYLAQLGLVSFEKL